MVVCIKTTVDITDSLLTAAKQVAAAESTTVRALIEEGLRQVLEVRSRRSGFTLPDESFGGNGLHADVATGSWSDIRDRLYEGRGS